MFPKGFKKLALIHACSLVFPQPEYHESELTVDFADLIRLLFPPLLLIWLRSLSLIVFFLLWSNSSSSIAMVDCKQPFRESSHLPGFSSIKEREKIVRERKRTGGFCSGTNLFSGFFTGIVGTFTRAERCEKSPFLSFSDVSVFLISPSSVVGVSSKCILTFKWRWMSRKTMERSMKKMTE